METKISKEGWICPICGKFPRGWAYRDERQARTGLKIHLRSHGIGVSK